MRESAKCRECTTWKHVFCTESETASEWN